MHNNILQLLEEMDIQVQENNRQIQLELLNLMPMVLNKPIKNKIFEVFNINNLVLRA